MLNNDKVVKEVLKADGDLYTKHDTIKLFSKYISDTETVFDNDFSQLPKAKQKSQIVRNVPAYLDIQSGKIIQRLSLFYLQENYHIRTLPITH